MAQDMVMRATRSVFGARVHIKGWAAAAWGVAWLGAALVMHAHFFWGNRRFGRSVAAYGAGWPWRRSAWPAS